MTTAKRAVTATSFRCPDWCCDREKPDHLAGEGIEVSPAETAGAVKITSSHVGVIGAFTLVGNIDLATGMTSAHVEFCAISAEKEYGMVRHELAEVGRVHDLQAAELRRLAADALAVAEWVESQ